MKQHGERDLSRIGWLDYVLMSLGSCLAVYSAGMSINLPSISYFCVGLVIVGTVVSYAVRVLSFRSIFIKFDALFYGLAVISAIFFSSELRTIMPDDGFPKEIIAASWLSWMLILGSFATWQDSTLLFQAIPALALFGLIGCYDTFRNVTFAFFGFVLCLATLFARAHGREMLQKSAQSGYFTRGLAPGTPIPSVDTTPGLALKLKQGPWRWVAGPEWALFSALGVVLISLLGAPVIRQSVAGVAGFVKISPPTSRGKSTLNTPANLDTSGSSVRIGRPFSHPIVRPLFEAKLDHSRYLRAEAYDEYTGRGWQNTVSVGPNDTGSSLNLANLMVSQMKEKMTIGFSIQLLRNLRLLPVPPEAVSVVVTGGTYIARPEGTYELTGSPSEITGRSVEINPSIQPVDALRIPELASYTNSDRASPRIRQLTETVTKGLKSDYAKAEAIQKEISDRIVYNLDAAETPSDRDPIDYTLFDEKQAYCTGFASAMVIMARTAGIPARYVQGYLPDERRHGKDGAYTISDADYHAWAELAFKDVGWVIFDPTIGAKSIPGEGLGDSGDNRPWYQKGFLTAAIDFLIVAVIAVIGLLGYRQFKAYKNPKNVRSELEKSYLVFNKTLEGLVGKRRWVGQTPYEFLEMAREALGPAYPAAKSLTDRFVNSLFSPENASTEVLLKIRDDVRKLKHDIKGLKSQVNKRAK